MPGDAFYKNRIVHHITTADSNTRYQALDDDDHNDFEATTNGDDNTATPIDNDLRVDSLKDAGLRADSSKDAGLTACLLYPSPSTRYSSATSLPSVA